MFEHRRGLYTDERAGWDLPAGPFGFSCERLPVVNGYSPMRSYSVRPLLLLMAKLRSYRKPKP